MRLLHRFHVRSESDESKMKRLEEAERECADLNERADRAINSLEERKAQNHWRESIEKMIHGKDP